MRRIFKTNKSKGNDLTPTPFTTPETPIHTQRTSNPASRFLPSRKSVDLSSSTLETHNETSEEERAYSAANDANELSSTQASTASLPPRTSPPSSYATGTGPGLNNSASTLPARSNSLKKKPKPLQTQGVFPWPDHRISPDPTNTQTTVESITSIRNPSPKHATDPSERVTEPPKEHHKEHRFRFFASSKGHDGDDDKDTRSTKSKDAPSREESEKSIKHFVQKSPNDRVLALHIAQNASINDTTAKDASREIRHALKYAEPLAQVNAARLWAFVIRHSPNGLFMRECTSRKFMDALDDILSNTKIQPITRDRVVDLLGSVVYECIGGDRKHPYAVAYRKVKPKGLPDEGEPFDPSDLFLNNTGPPQPQQTTPPAQRSASITDESVARSVTPASFPDPLAGTGPPNPQPTEANGKLRKARKGDSQREGDRSIPPELPPRGSFDAISQAKVETRPPPSREVTRENGRNRERFSETESQRERERERERARDRTPQVPSFDVELKRVIKDCDDAQGKAKLLMENVTMASADEVVADTGGVIQEFYTECVRSQERIMDQISWAYAQAERSRSRPANGRSRSIESLSLLKEGANGSPILPSGRGASGATPEEEMLAALLNANQILTDAIKMRDDWQRAAIAAREEREVQERSKYETRIDRSQLYVTSDGSLYAPDLDVQGAGSSRTPSPSLRSAPTHTESSPSSFNEHAKPPLPAVPRNQSYDRGVSPAPSPNPFYRHQYKHSDVEDIARSQQQYDQSQYGPTTYVHGPTPQIHHEPPTPNSKTPIVSPLPHRPAPHGPRAPLSHSRTPSPDLALQLRGSAPAAPPTGAASPGLHSWNIEVTPPQAPPGFPAPVPNPQHPLPQPPAQYVTAPPQSQQQPLYSPSSNSPYTTHQYQQNTYEQTPTQAQTNYNRSRHHNPPTPNSFEFPTSYQDKDQPHLDEDDGDKLPPEPLIPSEKALGKRKAVEKIPDPDAFDPDDLFKERRSQTPLSLYGVSLNSHSRDSNSSEEDLPGHYGHHHHKLRTRATVYAYDAAAEREAERQRLEQLEEAQRADSKITGYRNQVTPLIR